MMAWLIMVWMVTCMHCHRKWSTSRKNDIVICPHCMRKTPNDRSAFHHQRTVARAILKCDMDLK